MNLTPEKLALIERLLLIGKGVYEQAAAFIAREKSGNPLSDDELALLKAESDQAHSIIQAWKPAG